MILLFLFACGSVSGPDGQCEGEWSGEREEFTGTLEGDLSGTITLGRWGYGGGGDTAYDSGIQYFSGYFKPDLDEPYNWGGTENIGARSMCQSEELNGNIRRGWSEEDLGYVGIITGTISESGGQGTYTVDHLDRTNEEVNTWLERYSGSWSVSP